MENGYAASSTRQFLRCTLILVVIISGTILASARSPAHDRGAAAASVGPGRPDSALTTDVSGPIAGDTSWTLAGSPYVVTGDVTVNNGVTLTVEPGVEVRFDGNYALTVLGTLFAEGTVSQPVYFTSNQPEPSPGDWAFLDVRAESTGSLVRHAVIEYGGNATRRGAWCVEGALCVNTSSFELADSIVQHSATRGLVLVQSDATISDNTFDANAEEAIRLHACNYNIGACRPTINGNTFTNNASAISMHSGQDPVLAGNEAIDNDLNGTVLAQCGIRGDNTWEADLPYVVPDWCNLGGYGPLSLTIEPGAVIKIDGGGVGVGWTSVVTVAGTAELPVTVTSVKDDTVAGDTNNDGGATTPAPNDYCCIQAVGADADILFDHTVLRYGGACALGSGPNVLADWEATLTLRSCELSHSEVGVNVWRGSRLTIEDSRVHDTTFAGVNAGSDGEVLIKANEFVSATRGVYVGGGHPVIEGNVFYENSVAVDVICTTQFGGDCAPIVSPGNEFEGADQIGIANRYPAWVAIDARHNWWGDPSGPYHPASNPGGTGSAVGDGVRYAPWLQPFDWLAPPGPVLHGLATLRWAAVGRDATDLSVDVTAEGETFHPLGTGLASSATIDWDTTGVDDGSYELRATWRNVTSTVVGEAVRSVGVNNSPTLDWHDGLITADESWTAAHVHVVESDVTIAPSTTVTVAPGAVVKFAPETSLTVDDAAILIAQGTALSPIVFTALSDDEAAGDTNVDGAASAPHGGYWHGIQVQGSGQVEFNDYVDVRYAIEGHAGSITTDETWTASLVHHLTDDVTVQGGATLTLEPGAVIKVAPLRGIIVETGATIVAEGTLAQPVILTSLYDDTAGGDTNGDGALSAPAAGDWLSLYVDGGEASLDHVDVRYGGGSAGGAWSFSGALRSAHGARVQLSNSRVLHSFYDGVLVQGGEMNLENTVVADTDRGVVAWLGDATVSVLNATFDDNRIGLLAHGGTLDIVNTIVAHSLEVGIDRDIMPDPTVRYCDVWSDETGAVDYRGVGDRTGTEGNVSADPLFKDRGEGDYRLSAGSPAIDAADGSVAPASDLHGSPRFNDPASHNTGTPTPSGAYADIGALEFVETAHSDVDLVVVQVSGPISGTQDQVVEVTWTGRNDGIAPAMGVWHDAVYLSADTLWTPDDALLGESLHGGDVDAGATYSATAEVSLPGATPGEYRFIVRANARTEVFEGLHVGNNATAAEQTVALDIPELTLGVPAMVELCEDGEARYYRVTVPEGDDLRVDLDGPEGALAELYLKFGSVPSRQAFDFRSARPDTADQSVSIAGTQGGDAYYVLVYGVDIGGPTSLSVTARLAGFTIDRVSPVRGSSAGQATLSIYGAQFVLGSQPRLIDSSDAVLEPTEVWLVDSGLLVATFDLAAAALGPADIQVINPGDVTTSLTDVFEIVEGEPGHLVTSITSPARVRVGRDFQVFVDYANDGDTDLLAPVLRAEGTGINALGLSPDLASMGSEVALVGVNPSAPAGVLPPGAQGRITLYAHARDAGTDTFELVVDQYPHEPIDWAAIEPDVRPDGMTDEDWDPLFAQLRTNGGDYWDQYHSALAADATLLPPLLGPNHSLDRVFQLQVDRARAALCPSVSGSVFLNDAEHPLPNLAISLFNTETGESAETVSLMDGTFLIPSVISGTYTVSFEGAVLTRTQQLTVADGDLEDVTWILEPGASIEGHVLLDTGVPLTGVPVSAVAQDGTPFSTTSTEEGRFEIGSLPAGTYELRAGGEAYTEVSEPGQELERGEVRTNVSLVLAPAGCITGTVTGPGGPVEGALVTALGKDGLISAGNTSATGAYTVTGLASGVYSVSAAALDLWAAPVGGVEASAGRTTDPVDFTLSPAGAISGTTTFDGDGSPAPSVGVSASGANGVFGGASDSEGHLWLRRVPPGDYVLTIGGGLYMTQTEAVHVASSATTYVALGVAPLGVVTATVVDGGSGDPIPNVVVYETTGGELGASGITDRAGQFVFEAVGPGVHQVVVGEDFGPGVAQADVTIDRTHTSASVELSIAVAGVVSGTILEGDGVTAVEEAAVALLDDGDAVLSTVTEDAGRYYFVVLSDGVYDLQATAHGRAFDPIEGIPVNGGARVAGQNFVAGSGILNVIVQDGATGAPLRDALLEVTRADADVRLDDVGAFWAGVDGTVAITGVVPGDYRLMARAEGYGFATRTVTVPGADDPVTLSLGDPVSLSGVVLGEGAGPVRDAAVSLVSGDHSLLTSTDGSGRFELVELAPGTFDLSVVAPGFQQHVQSGLEIAAGELVLTPTLELADILVTGTVLGPADPVVRVLVVASDDVGRYAGHALTDDQGRFAIDTLRPGIASLVATAPGFRPSDPAVLSLSSGQVVSGTELVVEPVAISDPLKARLRPIEELTYYDRYFYAEPDPAWWMEEAELYEELKRGADTFPAECQEAHQEALFTLANYGKSYAMFRGAMGVKWGDRVYPIDEFAVTVFPRLIHELKQMEAPTSQVREMWRMAGGSGFRRIWESVRAVATGYGPYPESPRPMTVRAVFISHELKSIRFSDKMSTDERYQLWDHAANAYREISLLREHMVKPDVIPRANVDENGKVTGPSYIVLYLEADKQYEAIQKKLGEIQDAASALRKWDWGYNGLQRYHEDARQAVDALLDCAERHAPKAPKSSVQVSGGQSKTDDEKAQDPNDKTGPAGYGSGGYVQPATMAFEIQFENDPDLGATIPAQEVFVTDVLDDDLDLSTLEFTAFGFDNRTFSVPPGLAHYETTLDLRPEGIDLLVPVVLGLDARTRTIAATFRSLDPLTGQLPDDVDAGFLPVNDKELHNGEGFFSYLVRPKEGLTSGTVITNQARIVFDVNAPIHTPVTTHTLDTVGPASSVQPLPAQSPLGFTVAWEGEDDPGGSGVALYEIYVSEDDGPFTLWMTATTSSSASYPGGAGSTCGFYSVAVDGVGHREAAPGAPDATTMVANAIYLPVLLRN